VFVRLRISPARINLAVSNFARRFIGVQGRESPIFVNVAPTKAQNRINRPARLCCNVILLGFCDSHAYQVRAACGRRLGMCGYTSVPKDGRTWFDFVDETKIPMVNIITHGKVAYLCCNGMASRGIKSLETSKATRTSVFGDGCISKHADPTRGQRAGRIGQPWATRVARALADSPARWPIRPILGF